jgi:hypothetical protein
MGVAAVVESRAQSGSLNMKVVKTVKFMKGAGT